MPGRVMVTVGLSVGEALMSRFRRPRHRDGFVAPQMLLAGFGRRDLPRFEE